jgi:hypothetical protein
MEYGRLSDRLAVSLQVARLATTMSGGTSDEHNEYRDTAWGNAVGALVKALDPSHRLASAHAYADFLYPRSDWADYIITQQSGDEKKVNDWALQYLATPKPYLNEEYGYEGPLDKPVPWREDGAGLKPEVVALAREFGYEPAPQFLDEHGARNAARQLRIGPVDGDR